MTENRGSTNATLSISGNGGNFLCHPSCRPDLTVLCSVTSLCPGLSLGECQTESGQPWPGTGISGPAGMGHLGQRATLFGEDWLCPDTLPSPLRAREDPIRQCQGSSGKHSQVVSISLEKCDEVEGLPRRVVHHPPTAGPQLWPLFSCLSLLSRTVSP